MDKSTPVPPSPSVSVKQPNVSPGNLGPDERWFLGGRGDFGSHHPTAIQGRVQLTDSPSFPGKPA